MIPDLPTIGRTLYGPRWQCELARGLGVTSRTMRRWVRSPATVPWADIGPDCRELLAIKANEISAILNHWAGGPHEYSDNPAGDGA